MLLIFRAILRNQAIHIAFRDAHIPRPALIAFDELHPALLFEVLANGVRSQFIGGAVLRLCCGLDLRKQRFGKRDISSGQAHVLILADGARFEHPLDESTNRVRKERGQCEERGRLGPAPHGKIMPMPMPKEIFSQRLGLRPKTQEVGPNEVPDAVRVKLIPLIDEYRGNGLSGATTLGVNLHEAIGKISLLSKLAENRPSRC